MPELIDRQAVLAEIREFQIRFNETGDSHERVAYASAEHCMLVIKAAPTIEPEVRHGAWIECDYKHMEHGMLETEPKAGLCCSECRTAFQKKKMTHKQYCAACGARMDGGKGGEQE